MIRQILSFGLFFKCEGNNVEIKMIRDDQPVQIYLIEIVLKVKMKFKMPLKRHSVLAFVYHTFIDAHRIFLLQVRISAKVELFPVFFSYAFLFFFPNSSFGCMVLRGGSALEQGHVSPQQTSL